jgi:hypothetical protein
LPSLTGRRNTLIAAKLHAGYVAKAIGDVRLQRLEPYHAEQLKIWLENAGLAANTKHNCFGVFRQSLRYALRQGLVGRNIASPDYVD